MGWMLFIDVFNMCRMKNYNMNKKSNIIQISNVSTPNNMIFKQNLILLIKSTSSQHVIFTIHTKYIKFHMNQLQTIYGCLW
jgi:hypothetical protein